MDDIRGSFPEAANFLKQNVRSLHTSAMQGHVAGEYERHIRNVTSADQLTAYNAVNGVI